MIDLPEVLAGAILISLIGYALLGGADFGGGVWDLLASGPRAEKQRDTIAHAIGPIWEANHVWLILAVVLLFSAFPPAFARIMTVLHVPVTLMLVGIVLRGSSFVFRTYDREGSASQRRWGRIFAMSSVATPILLGTIIGAITTPAFAEPAGDATGMPMTAWPADGFVAAFVSPWLRPFPLTVGLFALAQFAFLAATYLTLDAEEPELREDFRRRALGAAVAVGVLALSLLALSGSVAPEVSGKLLGEAWSWPLQVVTATCALGAIAGLWTRRYPLARVMAAAQVALVLLGWGLAMSPWLIAGSLTLHEAAAPPETLTVLLIALGLGAALLLPSLAYLLRIFKARGGTPLAPPAAGDDTRTGGIQ